MSNQNKTTDSVLKDISNDNAVFKAKQDLDDLRARTKLNQLALEDARKLQSKELKEHEDTLRDIDNEISLQRSVLKRLKTDIRSNKKVLEDQDKQIDEAVTNGNAHIIDLQHEAMNTEEIKNRLDFEVAHLSTERDQLVKVTTELSSRLVMLDEKYKSQNELYQKTLSGLKDRILVANEELKTIQSQSKDILFKLMEKEKQLKEKELAFSKN